MKKRTRQFEVVPVSVVLQKVRPLEEQDSVARAFRKRCTTTANRPLKSPNLKQGK